MKFNCLYSFGKREQLHVLERKSNWNPIKTIKWHTLRIARSMCVCVGSTFVSTFRFAICHTWAKRKVHAPLISAIQTRERVREKRIANRFKSFRNGFSSLIICLSFVSNRISWCGLVACVASSRCERARLSCKNIYGKSVPISVGRTHCLTSWHLQLGTWPYVCTHGVSASRSFIAKIVKIWKRHQSTLFALRSASANLPIPDLCTIINWPTIETWHRNR